jgi:hypothetical protein
LYNDDIETVIVEEVVHTLPAGAVDETAMDKNNGFGNRHIFSFIGFKSWFGSCRTRSGVGGLTATRSSPVFLGPDLLILFVASGTMNDRFGKISIC